MGRGSKSKKKFSGRELHRQIQSGGGPEVGISAIINYSIIFIYCKKHMFVSLNSMSFLSVALPVMHLAIQNSSISYMMLEALCHQLVGLCRNRDNKSTLPVQFQDFFRHQKSPVISLTALKCQENVSLYRSLHTPQNIKPLL